MDGTPFGRYRLTDLVGRGGMGEVWRAYDVETDRVVAIKVLSAHLSEDEEFRRRFRREAHAATRLNSPHVIPIHNYGEINGRLYLDMRLIEGRQLANLLAQGPLDPARAVHIVGQVARALHAGHRVGLLHRDIKPSNVLVDEDDFAYLIDFGIARTLDETRLTKAGSAIGTFHYIAPERLAAGADEDARADIYSLACVLYECLIGSPPFPGDTMPQLVAAHLTAPPPRPSVRQPNLPVQVDNVIARGMAKDPNQRYATTLELVDDARAAISQNITGPPESLPAQSIRQAAGPTAPAVPPGAGTQQAPNVWSPAAVPIDPRSAMYPAESHWAAYTPARGQPAPLPHHKRRISPGKIALITGAATLLIVVATVIGFSVLGKHGPSQPSPAAAQQIGANRSGDAVRVASSMLVKQPGTTNPKAVVALYEDYLCPACGNFERAFGPTVAKLIDIGAIAADYSSVAILDSAHTQNYSSRAGAAASCVADVSIDAFRRFHAALFSSSVQPSETAASMPDNTRLIELAREAGAAGAVPDCVNTGKYLSKVSSAAAAAGITATPTIKINGQEYQPTTPDALVAKIKDIVGDVPGIDEAAKP